VSSEAGSRFDQNVTGFRGEEEFGFNATPYVATGKFVKILGLRPRPHGPGMAVSAAIPGTTCPVRRAHTSPIA
jgi:hypothetical protein